MNAFLWAHYYAAALSALLENLHYKSTRMFSTYCITFQCCSTSPKQHLINIRKITVARIWQSVLKICRTWWHQQNWIYAPSKTRLHMHSTKAATTNCMATICYRDSIMLWTKAKELLRNFRCALRLNFICLIFPSRCRVCSFARAELILARQYYSFLCSSVVSFLMYDDAHTKIKGKIMTKCNGIRSQIIFI